MRRGRGGPRLSLVLIALLVLSAADVFNGCVECVMYELSEMKFIYFSNHDISQTLWFQGKGQFNFTGVFNKSLQCSSPVQILPVPPDKACKLRNITIQQEGSENLTVYIDGKEVSHLISCPKIKTSLGIHIKTPREAKVFISEDLNLLTGNEFCSSIGSSLAFGIEPQYLLIMLAVAIAMVITLIYTIVIHCKYRQLMLKPVTAPMLTTLPESAQAKTQKNNSDLRKSCLPQDTFSQVAATYPQQTSFQVTYLQEGAPQFPPPRPSSLHDSENSLYGAVIF